MYSSAAYFILEHFPIFQILPSVHVYSPVPPLQIARPTALKKDNIQTRNRKLSQKSKKKRHSGFGGFLPGVDSRFGGYSGGMGMMGGSGMHHLPSPMSGYYPELHASMTSQVTPFIRLTSFTLSSLKNCQD